MSPSQQAADEEYPLFTADGALAGSGAAAHLPSAGHSVSTAVSRGRAVSRCSALQPAPSSAAGEAPAESSAAAAAAFMDHAAASRGVKPRPSGACGSDGPRPHADVVLEDRAAQVPCHVSSVVAQCHDSINVCTDAKPKSLQLEILEAASSQGSAGWAHNDALLFRGRVRSRSTDANDGAADGSRQPETAWDSVLRRV